MHVFTSHKLLWLGEAGRPPVHTCCLAQIDTSLLSLADVTWHTCCICAPLSPPPPYHPPQIKFFKSTMFRKTIETKSLSETRQVWESFIAMTKDAIQKRKPGE